MENSKEIKMKCEICGNEEGRIKYTKVINGEKVEFHICEKCARKKGFSNLVNSPAKSKEKKIDAKVPLTAECPFCGWKLYDVENKAKFGCPKCYDAFRSYIRKIAKEIHGIEKHKGKVPIHDKRTLFLKKRIREVKKDLDVAIKKEKYELAAELRDRIKTLSLKIEEK